MAQAAHLVADQQQERTMAASLTDHAKRISVQDGTSRSAPWEWLEEVSSAKEWTNDPQTLKMMGYLVKGDLDTSIHIFIRSILNGVNWEQLKLYISEHFLDQDEQEWLRKKGRQHETIHQDVQDYMVAFDQKVKRAYTLAERSVPLVH